MSMIEILVVHHACFLHAMALTDDQIAVACDRLRHRFRVEFAVHEGAAISMPVSDWGTT